MTDREAIDEPLWRHRPLFVFDGVCVLCSSGASFLMRHDRAGRVDFASAQSPLGQSLYRRLGLEMDATYLLIDGGHAYTKSDGYFRLATILGGWWRLALIGKVVPRGLRDWLYDQVAARRYRWFGKANHCELLSGDQRGRLVSDLDSDPLR
ncbi:thiol-disulfide oxidoreductase DCC family protein [Allosphingosinicella sp.]|uniref:thiol-disulfide oxidoreductase DCC family protein n=1 Tax=Allosphingosinicella sp. TaxID=2823234 RepID=UPI002FC20B0A